LARSPDHSAPGAAGPGHNVDGFREKNESSAMIVTIFRSRLVPEATEEYALVAEKMSELALSIPGHVSHKTFTAVGWGKGHNRRIRNGRGATSLGRASRSHRRAKNWSGGVLFRISNPGLQGRAILGETAG
jgi:hypothetical protein